MRKKHFHIGFLLLILLVAAWFRLFELQKYPPGLYPDEAMNGNNAVETLRTEGFKAFYPENNGREGLFINLQALTLKALGPDLIGSPWALRLPSALFGIFTVLGIYFLARELFSEDIALLSAFFLAVSFWHINFSRIGFRAIMAPFLLVFGAYYFLRAVKIRESKRALTFAALGGIIYGLGFSTYIAYRITPLLFLFFIPFFKARKNFWKSTFVFAVTAALSFLPLGLYFLDHPADFFGRTTQVSVFSSATPLKDLSLNIVKTIGMFHFRGDLNERHNLAGTPELSFSVGIFFLIGLTLGLRSLLIKNSHRHVVPDQRFSYLLLFGWFVLAMLPVVVSNEGIPHALRAILMIPPIMILSAIGALATYRALLPYIRPTILFPISFVLLSILMLQTYRTYFIIWGPQSTTADAFAADYVALGEFLNTLPKEIPKYVVVEGGGVLVRGIPMPAQTVMFITDTFTPERQQKKNIYYLLPGHTQEILPKSLIFSLK